MNRRRYNVVIGRQRMARNGQKSFLLFEATAYLKWLKKRGYDTARVKPEPPPKPKPSPGAIFLADEECIACDERKAVAAWLRDDKAHSTIVIPRITRLSLARRIERGDHRHGH